jgi:hypothetical protein
VRGAITSYRITSRGRCHGVWPCLCRRQPNTPPLVAEHRGERIDDNSPHVVRPELIGVVDPHSRWRHWRAPRWVGPSMRCSEIKGEKNLGDRASAPLFPRIFYGTRWRVRDKKNHPLLLHASIVDRNGFLINCKKNLPFLLHAAIVDRNGSQINCKQFLPFLLHAA